MATYNSVTFNELAEGSMFRPYWEREANMSIRHIPYGGKDNVQSAGLGNPKLVVQILVLSDANMDTLIASVGATARTLTNLFVASNDFGNVYLIGLDSVRRWDHGEKWTATATFMREGS